MENNHAASRRPQSESHAGRQAVMKVKVREAERNQASPGHQSQVQYPSSPITSADDRVAARIIQVQPGDSNTGSLHVLPWELQECSVHPERQQRMGYDRERWQYSDFIRYIKQNIVTHKTLPNDRNPPKYQRFHYARARAHTHRVGSLSWRRVQIKEGVCINCGIGKRIGDGGVYSLNKSERWSMRSPRHISCNLVVLVSRREILGLGKKSWASGTRILSQQNSNPVFRAFMCIT